MSLCFKMSYSTLNVLYLVLYCKKLLRVQNFLKNVTKNFVVEVCDQKVRSLYK